MKVFRLIGMALVAMCMSFASCSNEEVVAPENPQEENYVTVGLGCTGEFLEFSESNMGRAATDELYGIQVYALTEDGTDMDGNPYYSRTPYAYGVYASLENVKIRLLEGQKYKFEVGIVVNPSKTGTSVYHLFYTYLSENTTEFTYSSTATVYADCTFMDVNNVLKHDRYYGELDMYTPQENGTVDINTKRVAYGVRYETIGLAADESFTVEVSRQGSYDKLYSVEVGSDPLDDIYTFQSIRDAWYGIWNHETQTYQNYTSDKTLTISWNKADSTIVPMGSYPVTFKRNVKTTIRINAEDLNLGNGIRVFKENIPMIDDETIYEITGGSVVEIPVTPGN